MIMAFFRLQSEIVEQVVQTLCDIIPLLWQTHKDLVIPHC